MAWTFDPSGELEQMRKQMDSFLGRFGMGGMGPSALSDFPALSLYESEDMLIVVAELPGIAREGLQIRVLDGALEISGRRTLSGEEKGYKPLKQERMEGEFRRSLPLPLKVDMDRVEASLKDGLLKLLLPKAESTKPRNIHIG